MFQTEFWICVIKSQIRVFIAPPSCIFKENCSFFSVDIVRPWLLIRPWSKMQNLCRWFTDMPLCSMNGEECVEAGIYFVEKSIQENKRRFKKRQKRFKKRRKDSRGTSSMICMLDSRPQCRCSLHPSTSHPLHISHFCHLFFLNFITKSIIC